MYLSSFHTKNAQVSCHERGRKSEVNNEIVVDEEEVKVILFPPPRKKVIIFDGFPFLENFELSQNLDLLIFLANLKKLLNSIHVIFFIYMKECRKKDQILQKNLRKKS